MSTSQRYCACLLVALLILLTTACSKRQASQLVIEIPDNFSGSVQVQLGVPGAPELTREGDGFRISVPPHGKVVTSTMIPEIPPTFVRTASDRIWGYAHSTAKTGDGYPVRGVIEFFVGTKDQYETFEVNKHKSGLDRLFRPRKLNQS